MKSKTWKLGEVCQGGVITVEITNTEVSVIAKEWDTSTGYNKGSNQSNAKEFNRRTVKNDGYGAYYKLDEFLNELTTSYHSGEIMSWIYSNVKLSKEYIW